MRFLEDEVYVYHYKLIMKDDKNAPPTDEGLAENTWEWHQVRPFEPISAASRGLSSKDFVIAREFWHVAALWFRLMFPVEMCTRTTGIGTIPVRCTRILRAAWWQLTAQTARTAACRCVSIEPVRLLAACPLLRAACPLLRAACRVCSLLLAPCLLLAPPCCLLPAPCRLLHAGWFLATY